MNLIREVVMLAIGVTMPHPLAGGLMLALVVSGETTWPYSLRMVKGAKSVNS